MNKDKVIKDLKERNDKLQNQYMEEQARNFHLNNQVEKLIQENEHLKNIINVYENSNDVTKMFMYTDEITQDTINKLNELRRKNE